jgi:hypothetical protein
MANQNQFFSEAGTFSIDQVIKGQTPLTFYDPLKQVAYQPELRRGANGKIASVLPYADAGLEGLFAQLQSKFGSDKKMVKARKFYWAEYDQFQTFAFAVGKSLSAVPSGGVGVTVSISRASLSQNGLFAKPIAGFRAMVKENNQQVVDITTVTETSTGYNVTLTPINGEVLNLTSRGQYTIVMASMRNYQLENTPADIQGQGIVKNPPALYESYVQKYEQRLDVDESEIDNYVYDKDIMIAKGLDHTGKEIEYFYVPQLSKEIEGMLVQNRTWRTLFNQRDNVNDQDFDGLIPTMRKYGMFNYAYDSFLGGSFKSLLFSIIKSLRKINGSNDYFLIHDFNFGIDWGEAIKEVVRNSNQDYKYQLFGEGGMGIRDFEYFQFQNFKWSNYNFLTYQMDVFDSYRYGRPLEYFAALLPAKAYSDTDGNRVPILNYVNIMGAEAAAERKVWHYDFREQGKRIMSVFAKDSFGIEIHKPTQLGMIWRGNTNSN